MQVNATWHDNYYNLMITRLELSEYKLVVNAIKRQVDYYRSRVFDIKDDSTEQAHALKHHYKIYQDLYNKIICDYEKIVKE